MYLVIDVGGTYTKYGYFDLDGNCFKQGKYPTIKTNKEEFYNEIILLAKDVKGIAISIPGLIDSQKGYVHAITLLPFLAHQNIKQDLQEQTHLPVTIENDAKCATLGELWKGHLQNVHNGLFLVFGSGIGGTLIINGQMMISPRYKAGEIGSLLMPKDLQYKEMTNFGAHNNANQIIQKISQAIHCQEDGFVVFDAIQKNQTAYQIFEQYCREIAFTIYNLDYILDLDIVCIGGGISEQPLFIETVQKQFQQLRDTYKEDDHQPIITACLHHNQANRFGALYHFQMIHK